LCDHDVGRALAAVADGAAAGRDPRRLAEELLAHLRNNFLALMARSALALSDDAAVRAEEQGRRLGPAALVRAMEAVGDALMQMREALDPRVSLEVALVRVARPEVDTSPAALVERIERLERGQLTRSEGDSPPPGRGESPPERQTAAPPSRSTAPKPALGALRKKATTAVTAAAGKLPSRDDLTTAWADAILPKLSRRVGVWFKGRFVSVDDAAVFAVEDSNFLERAEKYRSEVEAALAAHFGTPVPLELIVEDAATTNAHVEEDHDEPDFDGPTADAPAASPEEHVKMAFPGAEEITDE
jgi:DNA polymerase III gamma/tau subunit